MDYKTILKIKLPRNEGKITKRKERIFPIPLDKACSFSLFQQDELHDSIDVSKKTPPMSIILCLENRMKIINKIYITMKMVSTRARKPL